MAEKEYIEREAVLHELLYAMCGTGYQSRAMDAVHFVHAADVVEVVHAHWIDRDEKTWCSKCDASNKQYKPPYCPHCGARMDGERKEQDNV